MRKLKYTFYANMNICGNKCNEMFALSYHQKRKVKNEIVVLTMNLYKN